MILFPKLGPWYMAQTRIAVVSFVTLPLAISTEFWKTWAAVYSPEPRVSDDPRFINC